MITTYLIFLVKDFRSILPKTDKPVSANVSNISFLKGDTQYERIYLP